MRPASTVRQPRAFEAGSAGRRLRSIPNSPRAINSLIRQYGTSVVARSRHLAINNPYAAMAREAFVGTVVGTGITPTPRTTDQTMRTALKETFGDWVDEADADYITDFYGQQAVAAGEIFEAGEIFVRFRDRLPIDGLLVPLQLQLLPSEMVPIGLNRDLGGGRRIECGIEFDAIGRRVAYHFRRSHPGTEQTFGQNNIDVVAVPADEVLHLYKPIRAGQIRGIPHTLSAIAKLAILDLYDDAELERKRIAALFTAFVTRKSTDDTDPILGNQQALVGTSHSVQGADYSNVPQSGPVGSAAVLEPGATVDLGMDEDVKFAEPADVGSTYEPFQYRNLLAVAAGFGIPYAEMTGDLRQANYGSIRAGLITFRRRASQFQKLMVFQLCRATWNRWLDAAVIAEAVEGLDPLSYSKRMRELRRVKWTPPAWEWIDPLKDVQGEKIAVQQRFKARRQVVEEQGFDVEEVDNWIGEDYQRLEDTRGGEGVPQVLPDPAPEILPGATDTTEPTPTAPTTVPTGG